MTQQRTGSRQDEPVVRRGGALVGAAVSAAVVAAMAVLLMNDWAPITDLDKAIADPVHDWALHTPWAVSWSEALSLIGSTPMNIVLILIVLVVLLVGRRWWIALAFAGTAAFAPFLSDVIKDVVERPRPVWADPIVPVPDSYAYTSSHATSGIAVWLAAGLALSTLIRSDTGRAWFVLPWVLIGLDIGLSRIVLGVHWPTDVLGGWLLAAAIGGVLAALFVLPSSGPALSGPPGGPR